MEENNNDNNQNNKLIEKKESFFSKIINKIKNIFSSNNKDDNVKDENEKINNDQNIDNTNEKESIYKLEREKRESENHVHIILDRQDDKEQVDEVAVDREEENDINDEKSNSKKNFIDGLKNFDKKEMDLNDKKRKIENGDLDIEKLDPEDVIKLIKMYQDENETINKRINEKEDELEK